MASVTFKKGSTPYTLHMHFSEGKSLTYDEAYKNMDIRHLTQRVADLKKKFEEAGHKGLILVMDESNERGGTHARYFYAGCGCVHEGKDGVRVY